MSEQRRIEIFSAGCGLCDDVVAQVRDAACSSCDVAVLDLHDAAVAERARELGISRAPAVVIDGNLADCCAGNAVDIDKLRALGLGTPGEQGAE